MTLEQLETLLKRAEDVQGCKIRMVRDYDGDCSIRKHSVLDDAPLYTTFDQCIATLKQWATPPKPKTLTLTLDFTYCENIQRDVRNNGGYLFELGGPLDEAISEALAPYQQPE